MAKQLQQATVAVSTVSLSREQFESIAAVVGAGTFSVTPIVSCNGLHLFFSSYTAKGADRYDFRKRISDACGPLRINPETIEVTRAKTWPRPEEDARRAPKLTVGSVGTATV